jgi:hypothetical protein
MLDEAFINVIKVLTSKKMSPEQLGISMTLFHYYSYSKAFIRRDFDRSLLAVVCVFLSSKMTNVFMLTDEALNEYNKLLSASYKSIRKNENMKTRTSDDIINLEMEILNFLNFEINIIVPYSYQHQYIENYIYRCHKLNKSVREEEVLSLTSNIINDSYRLPLCVYYSPVTICLSCLFIAINIVDVDSFSFNELQLIENNFDKDEVAECIDKFFCFLEGRLNIRNKKY